MTLPLKLLTALPLVALAAACVPGGNDVVDTPAEVEATVDQDIDGDGTIMDDGVETAAPG